MFTYMLVMLVFLSGFIFASASIIILLLLFTRELGLLVMRVFLSGLIFASLSYYIIVIVY